MLTSPRWFSSVDERRINLALQRAVAALLHTPGGLDTAAVHAVLQVLKVVAVTIERHRDRQPIEALVAARDDLRDQVIAQIDRVRSTIQTTLDEFAQMVRAELEQQSWWVTFPETVSPPVVTTTTPASRQRKTRDVSRLQVERESVNELLDEVDWTPTRWAKEAGIDPHVVLGYLAGTSTPRKPYKIRMRVVLAKALNRTTLTLPN